MKFENFKNDYFEGNTEKAIECMAKERGEYNLTRNAKQWYKIYKSFTDEQLKLYKNYCKSYNTLELNLNCREIFSIAEEYRENRKWMIITAIIGIAFWCFVLIPLSAPMWLYIIPSLLAIIFLSAWIIKRNNDMNELLAGKFYIVKSAISHKELKEDFDSDSGLAFFYYIHFPGYDKYELKHKFLYEGAKYGDEYYLIILEKNRKKIEKIYSAEYYKISDEFNKTENKFTLKTDILNRLK